MKKIIWGIVLTIVFTVSMLSSVLAMDYTDPDICHRRPPIIKVLDR